MGSSFLGAYWGDRPESAEQCGQRLARCIAALGRAEPALGAWFRLGESRETANIPVGLDQASLTELLAEGRTRREGKVVEELGFLAGFGIGRLQKSA
jgi:hypothetical protein